MSVEALKLALINKIIALTEAHQLRKVASTIDDIQSKDPVLEQLQKPMRKTLDIEQLKREQQFQAIDKKALFEKIDSLNIEEPIEDLLRMI